MPHVMHLIKDPGNSTALEVIRTQATDPSIRLSIVLMHDAVRLAEPLPGRIYRLRDSHAGLPPQSGSDAIGSSELLDLVFMADSIVTW